MSRIVPDRVNSRKQLLDASRVRLALTAALLVAALPLLAQYPGQYPPGQYPPGQDPAGQYPSGTGGTGIPHLGKKKTQNQDDPNAVKLEGTVAKIDANSMVIQAADTRIVTFKLTQDTKFVKAADSAASSNKSGDKNSSSSSDSSNSSSGSKTKQSGTANSLPAIQPSAVKPGALVMVEATQDDEGIYTARRIALEQPAEATLSNPTGTPKDTGDTPEGSGPMVTRAPPEDPNRPHLTRGAKQGQPEQKDDTPVAEAPYAGVSFEKDTPKPSGVSFENEDGRPAPATDPRMMLLDKTREWLGGLTSALPNYVCNQLTTRYMLQSKSTGWQAMDVVAAELVFENGHEDYRKITINGKSTSKGMMDIGGSTSTGEYATTLYGLFYEGTHTHFKYNGPTHTGGKDAVVYDFTVDRPNSAWQISRGGQSITPGYSGSVWVEKETGHVLRVEMQADGIPKSFPLDKVESTVEYDMVRISGEPSLLPVHSENLGCERGTPYCSRNVIEFRNYHKFGSESTITFDK
jgi:hypothetical protein